MMPTILLKAVNHTNTSHAEDFAFEDRFGENRLILMAQNHHTLFVYWEIDWRRQSLVARHFGCDWSHLPKIIRVYDVTGMDFNGHNAHHTFDILLNPLADNWYIREVEPGRNYLVDYGTTTGDGRFFTIVRSNVVQLPGRGGRYHG